MLRVRVLTPSWQVCEHAPQAPQGLTRQSCRSTSHVVAPVLLATLQYPHDAQCVAPDTG